MGENSLANEPTVSNIKIITLKEGVGVLQIILILKLKTMAGTFTKLYYHFIFSTKNRMPMIYHEHEELLYKYIGGIVRKEKGVLCQIGGMPDHVHLLIGYHQNQSLADLMRMVKSKSSGWLKTQDSAFAQFAWQDGYGVFSVSESQVGSVAAYIQNQKKHHEIHSFKSEFLAFLQAHKIEYDERFIWK